MRRFSPLQPSLEAKALLVGFQCQVMCYPGVGGYDGDGDITKPENLVAFQEYVLEVTNGEGVHFVMADGVRINFVFTSSSVIAFS